MNVWKVIGPIAMSPPCSRIWPTPNSKVLLENRRKGDDSPIFSLWPTHCKFPSFLPFYPKQKPNQIDSAIALPSFLPPQLNIAASPTTTTTNEWTRGRVSAQVANVISIKRKQLEQLLLVLVSLALSRPSPPIPIFI